MCYRIERATAEECFLRLPETAYGESQSHRAPALTLRQPNSDTMGIATTTKHSPND